MCVCVCVAYVVAMVVMSSHSMLLSSWQVFIYHYDNAGFRTWRQSGIASIYVIW